MPARIDLTGRTVGSLRLVASVGRVSSGKSSRERYAAECVLCGAALPKPIDGLSHVYQVRAGGSGYSCPTPGCPANGRTKRARALRGRSRGPTGRAAAVVRALAAGQDAAAVAARYGVPEADVWRQALANATPGELDAMLGWLSPAAIRAGLAALPPATRRRVILAAVVVRPAGN